MKIKKMIIIFLVFLLTLFFIAFVYFFVGKAPQQKNILWGVDFSQMHTEALGLDWKKTYSAIIDDLGVKNIKLHTQWNFVEGQRGKYFFEDIDWQIKEAKRKDVNIIFVLGLKTGRWPECHEPEWVKSLSEKEQKENILKYIEQIVLRYRGVKNIIAWQVENEPLLKFGVCPDWYYKDKEFLKKEVELVRSLDNSKKIMISDSGELNWWIEAAKIGDIVGTTMYRKAWVNVSSFGFPIKNPGFYGSYPIPPIFYYRKANIIKTLFGKEVICVELQAEPWAPEPFYNISIKEQKKSMDLEQFKKNIEFAKNTGLKEFYFWGVEWWYWTKEKHNKPEFWEEAKKLFK